MPRREGRWYEAGPIRLQTLGEVRRYWWSRLLDVGKWVLIVLFLAGFFVAMLIVMGTWDWIQHPVTVINPSPTRVYGPP